MFVFNEGSIDLPTSWKDETINVFTSVSSGGNFSFTIARDSIPWGMAFSSFAHREIDGLKDNLKDYEELVREPMTVGGNEAVMAEFRWVASQGPMHQCMVIVANDQRVLIFTASMKGQLSEEQKAHVLDLLGGFEFAKTGDRPDSSDDTPEQAAS